MYYPIILWNHNKLYYRIDFAGSKELTTFPPWVGGQVENFTLASLLKFFERIMRRWNYAPYITFWRFAKPKILLKLRPACILPSPLCPGK